MPHRSKITKALRFLKKNPRIPAKGIRFIGNKLQETEEEGQTQAYLKNAYTHLRKNQNYSLNHPIMRNIRRLSTSIGRR